MAWLILFLAGLCEVIWAMAMKYSEGFSRLIPTLIMIVGMTLSVCLLSYAMKTLPAGSAYAVWTGIGTVGAAICGMILFGESTSPARIISLLLIIIGLIGLRVTSP